MTQHAALFILYVLIILPAMGIALLCGLALFAHRHVNGQSRWAISAALLCAGIFVEGLSLLIAGGFGYITKPVPTLGYAWAFWIGRALLAASVWNFARAIFGRGQ